MAERGTSASQQCLHKPLFNSPLLVPQVEDRLKRWKNNRIHHTDNQEQLEWAAEVVQYVHTMWHETHPRKSSKFASTFRPLSREVPLYGPRFVPPTYLNQQKHSSTPEIRPEVTYLKPITIVHPFYFPGLSQCPKCRGSDMYWDRWMTSRYRDVHGVASDELAIGFQLRCETCEKVGEKNKKKRGAGLQYCWSTTSAEFWEDYQDFEVSCKS